MDCGNVSFSFVHRQKGRRGHRISSKINEFCDFLCADGTFAIRCNHFFYSIWITKIQYLFLAKFRFKINGIPLKIECPKLFILFASAERKIKAFRFFCLMDLLPNQSEKQQRMFAKNGVPRHKYHTFANRCPINRCTHDELEMKLLWTERCDFIAWFGYCRAICSFFSCAIRTINKNKLATEMKRKYSTNVITLKRFSLFLFVGRRVLITVGVSFSGALFSSLAFEWKTTGWALPCCVRLHTYAFTHMHCTFFSH